MAAPVSVTSMHPMVPTDDFTLYAHRMHSQPQNDMITAGMPYSYGAFNVYFLDTARLTYELVAPKGKSMKSDQFPQLARNMP